MKVKLLLLLCVTAAIYCSTERLFKPQPLAARTDVLRARLLQATGYSAGSDADEKKYCDDAGIEFEADLVVSEVDLKVMSGSFDTKFTSVGMELLDLIKSGAFNAGYSAKATKIVTKLPLIVLSIIGAALIVLFLILAIVYGLVKCLCGAGKKDDEKERNKEEKEKSYQDKQENKENQQNQNDHHHSQGRDHQNHKNQQEQGKQDYEIPAEDKIPSKPRDPQHQQEENQQNNERKQNDRDNEKQKQNNQQSSENSRDGKQNQEKENKDKEKLENAIKVQNRWKYASYGLCVAAFSLTIIWFVYLAIAVSKVKFVLCGVAGFKRIAVQGDLKGSFKFAGANGLSFLAQKALDNVGSFPAASVSTQLTSINSKNFATESAQVLSDFNSIKYPESRYEYVGIDGSTKIIAPSVQDYTRRLYPGDLKLEASAIINLASGLGAAATVFAKAPQVSSDSVNTLKTALDVSLRIPAEKFLQMVGGGAPDYMSGIKRLGLVVLILGGILIFVALIIVGLVLYHVAKLLAALSGDSQDDSKKEEEKKQREEEQKRQDQEKKRQDEQNRNSNNDQNNSDGHQNQEERNHLQGQQSDEKPSDPADDQRQNQAQSNQENRKDNQQNQNQSKNENTQHQQNQNKDHSSDKGGCLKKLLSLSGAKIVQLVVALLLIVLSLAIFIYAIAAVFGSVAFSTVCNLSNKVLFEGQFVNDLAASGYLTPQASSILKECISATGSGNIKNILGSSLPSDLIAMIEGGGSVAAYASFKAKNTEANPPVSTAFSTKLGDLVLLKKADSDSNKNDVEAGKLSINSNKCSSDTAGYNDGVCASSAPTDADNTGLGSSFCFNFNSFQTAGYPTRYQSGVTCSGVDAAAGQKILTNTLKAAAAYKTSVTSLQTDFNLYYQGAGSAKGIKQLYADLKAVDADVTAISANSGIKALIDSQAGFNGGLESSGNCTLLRKGIIATQVAVCEKVFKPFYTQMGLSFANACALLGAGIALLGSCYYTSKVELLTS